MERFFERLWSEGYDCRTLGNAKVAAIGSQTAAKLKNYGIIADIVPTEFRAEGIVDALQGEIQPGMNILLARALEARDVLPEKLREMGASVNVVPVYRTVTGTADRESVREQLTSGEIDVVTFTSSSTVTNLLQLLGADATELISKTKVACIGPITAETCEEYGIKPDVKAEEYTITGLVKAIQELYGEEAK